MNLTTIAITLFLIMDSIGNTASFLKMTDGIAKSRQRRILIREMGIALLFMVLFNYIGEFIFLFLKLSETAVMLSAGLILFLTAVKIIFSSQDNPRSHVVQQEPFIVPLAVPLICGPALMATIMLYAHVEESQTVMLGAIFIAWALSVLVLLIAPGLQKVAGRNGLMAVERLLALILVILAIQRFMEGIRLFINTYA